MKNRILTNTRRTVRRSFPRFISLLLMSMLGVFVFSGLKATSPDMINTLDRYLDKYDTYDLRAVCDMGLTDTELDIIKAADGIACAEGSFFVDLPINTGGSETVLRVSSLPEKINLPELISGRLPCAADEIAVEENYLTKNGLALGDTVPLDTESFICSSAVIVGTVRSSLYFNNAELSQERGSSSVGTGTVGYYSYMTPGAFDTDIYSLVYITAKGAKEQMTSGEEYLALTDTARKNTEKLKQTICDSRYDTVYRDAEKTIKENEDKLNSELEAASQKLRDAETKLRNGKAELDAADAEISSGASELASLRRTLDDGKASYTAALASSGLDEQKLGETAGTLEKTVSELSAALAVLPVGSPEHTAARAKLGIAQSTLGKVRELIAAKEKLDVGEAAYREGTAKLESGKKEIAEKREQYLSGLNEYNASLSDYEAARSEGESKLADARRELSELRQPSLTVFDRTDDTNYSGYIDDAGSIDNLSGLFPAVFFAVAVLVSLISMNRMVEEERGEIGAMKSLGFGNARIMSKYVIFSLSATVIGSTVGAALGLVVLPSMIFGIYGILFDVPDLALGLNPVSTLIGFLLTVICVCGTSVLTALRELKAKPSELMRPKAPKNGKRVALQRIGFIWNRLNFSGKVTVRNLFRYKKRVIVTVAGIAGCTALMLCGFGVRDSVTDIADMQFGQVFHFDATAYINDDVKDIGETFSFPGVTDLTVTERVTVTADGKQSTLFAAEDLDSLTRTVTLTSPSGQAVIPESGKAVITEKLSALTGIAAGDEIVLLGTDGRQYTFTVSGVALNYVDHYIFVDADTYRAAGGEFSPNLIYLRLTPDADHTGIRKELLKKDGVLNVSFNSEMIDNVSDMLTSLNSVVAILIVLAALLAFVVLYNLASINITERKREIATLKVLGFYDREVDSYITRETALLTALGIIIGLVAGIFFTNAVVSTVEIERCRFIHNISPLSFIFSAALSAVFTLTVNAVTHFRLKRIDMIESLKSVE